MIDDVPVAPNIWTDGSREPIPHLDVEIAGAGAFVHSPAIIFDSKHWGHAQGVRAALTSFREFWAQFSLSKGLSIGWLFLLCRLFLVFLLVLTI